MSIKLTKGERFNLSQEVPNFNKLAIALGWQVSQTAQNCDIDASVFMLAADGRIPDEKYFVFYNNLTSPDGAVRHSGDSRNGQIEGDDETVYLDLSKINAAIQEIMFVVTLHEGQEKNQSFSQVTNAFIRLYNSETGNELVRYNLNQIFSQETALEFGRLYRKNGDWRFQAVGQGYNAGLQSFVDRYYVENAVTQGANAGGKVDDAEVLRLFCDRVDKQLQEKTAGESVANPVNADNLEADKDVDNSVKDVDDSVSEIQEPPITAEEFLRRYKEGERDFTGINLAGVDLSGKTLESPISLSQANLSNANLSNANLMKANLIGANLQGANLKSTNLQQADLIQANFSGANLTKANLNSARLIQANLSQANLSETQLNSANLTTANLSSANLTQAILNSANLIGADLSQAKVTKVSLSYADLRGVKLNGVSLVGVNLDGANLTKVNLKVVSLIGSSLQQANLSGQNLSGLNLSGVSFYNANLSGANLTSANLCGANLSYANLEKANLKDANWVGATIANAKLAGAIMPDGTTHE